MTQTRNMWPETTYSAACFREIEEYREFNNPEKQGNSRQGPWTSAECEIVKADRNIARKRQDNEIFDAKMKKKDSERKWRAHDCRPSQKNWIELKTMALSPEILKALREKGL